MISLRQIHYFVATADNGQVSLAAQSLFVSQSTITIAIKKLEQTLRCSLFKRTINGMTLTPEGQRFLHHAHHILASVEEALRSPRSNATLQGQLRLMVSYTVSGYFLAPYLARFQRSFPQIQVFLQEDTRPAIEQRLLAGSCDLAMVLCSNLHRKDALCWDLLLSSKRRLWLCAGHPLLEQAQLTFAEIAQHPYIMLLIDEARKTTLRYWRNSAYRPQERFCTSSVEAVRSMVAIGSGVTILSDMVYRPWSLEGRRVEVRSLATPIPTMDIGLVWSKERERSPATLAFHEFMHLAVGGKQASTQGAL